MIDITLLGTAATMPTPERALSSAMLHLGGHAILFDCGEGTQTAARRAHVSLMKLDLIALTHYHGDHFFGMPGLLQTLACMGREAPLYIAGPQGLETALAPILQLSGPMPFSIFALNLPKEGLMLHEIIAGWPKEAQLVPIPTVHRVVSQGYRFALNRPGRFDPAKAQALGVPVPLWRLLQLGEPVTVEGRTTYPQQVIGAPRKGLSVVFSGDTAPCAALETAAQGADLLIHDATYGEDSQSEMAQRHGHSTFSQAAALAARAQVKQLLLTHFSQMMPDPAACLPAAWAHFPDTQCGQDGQTLTLRFQ